MTIEAVTQAVKKIIVCGMASDRMVLIEGGRDRQTSDDPWPSSGGRLTDVVVVSVE